MTKHPIIRYPFESIANFRDVGGYMAGPDAMVRWGVFFRSARLCSATEQDIAALKALGIRTIIDLRMAEEVATRPDVCADDPDFSFHHLSLMGDVMAGMDHEEILKNPDRIPPMSTLYQYMITGSPDGFRQLIALLAERVQHGSVLFHCTAGKDRTGLTAMFLQAICGVDEMDMIAHYEVSHTYNMAFMPEDTTGSMPANLRTLLAFLDREYGGPVSYLQSIGVPESDLDIIRERLRQPIEAIL